MLNKQHHARLRFMLLLLMLCITSAFRYPAALSDDTTGPDLHAIRKLLMAAIDNKKTTDSLYSSLAAIKNKSALINGYLGTLEALKAKHAWNPYYKIKYINSCEDTFKGAVSADPHNVEIRFMRFSIEHNLPGFLGYGKNLTEDRLEMIRQIDRKNYASTDQHLMKVIILFLIDSKRCSPSEQKNLQEQLAAL